MAISTLISEKKTIASFKSKVQTVHYYFLIYKVYLLLNSVKIKFL